MPSAIRAAWLCVGLASCASGGQDAYVGDDGDAQTISPEGAADDASAADATSTNDVGAADTSTRDTGGGSEAGPGPEAGPIQDAAGQDTGPEASPGDGSPPPDAGTPETGPDDSGSLCPEHGFSGALATFDLTGQAGSETSAAATASATGVTADPITRSVGLTPVSGTGSINSSGWSLASSADRSLYYSFTLTPAAGCSITLTSLAIDVKASATGPSTLEVGTSVDNYEALSTAFAGTSTGNVSLSATSSGAVTVHVFGYAATASAGTLRIENTMTVSGTLE